MSCRVREMPESARSVGITDIKAEKFSAISPLMRLSAGSVVVEVVPRLSVEVFS